MSKLDEYNARAAESLIALEAATTERDRLYHRRAYGIWRNLIAGMGDGAKAPSSVPAPKPAASKAAASRVR